MPCSWDSITYCTTALVGDLRGVALAQSSSLSPDTIPTADHCHIPAALLAACDRCAAPTPQWELREFNGRAVCPNCFRATLELARDTIRALQKGRDGPKRRCFNCRAMVDQTVRSAWCPLIELGAERAILCENFVPIALQEARDHMPISSIQQNAEDIWMRVRTDLEATLSSSHAAWLKDTQGVALEGDVLHVQVPNEYTRAWLEARLAPAIARALELNGYPELVVTFEVDTGSGAPGSEFHGGDSLPEYQGTKTVSAEEPPVGALAPISDAATRDTKMAFNPAYTFERFVVGSGNRLAHASALAVAEQPGKHYNPLFLYGGVGVGKTHLLQAIGHRWVSKGGSAIYVTSETFTNELIAAIRDGSTTEFRRRYRYVDILLVDDIHFIGGKEATQEEFFHTFNALYDHGKQIVLSSDRPPGELKILEERLRSRFAWGLLADIQPPDLETRVAILKAKAALRGRHVPDEILEYLAARITQNIRELEGALNRLLALADLNGVEPSLVLAAGLVPRDKIDGAIHSTDVLQAVSAYYHIAPSALSGRQRDRSVTLPRQIAMYLLREDVKLSLPQIGEILGGRDHSTVIYGCDKVGAEMKRRSRIRQDVESIRSLLYSGKTA
jgi:chromosomal replication initiator protein